MNKLKRKIRRIRAHFSRKRETVGMEPILRDRKVLVVGPNSSINDQFNEFLEAADIAVFINKGHRSDLVVHAKGLSKELMLSHCLETSEDSGGGEINTKELRRKGFLNIICPFNSEAFDRNISLYHCTNRGMLPLWRPAVGLFQELRDDIEGYLPNTGYATIWCAVKSGCSTLYVTGFDFLRTSYKDGYHSFDRSYEELIALIESHGNHNPDRDLDSFRGLHGAFDIKVDSVLEEILAKPTEKIFYQGAVNRKLATGSTESE